MTTVKNLGDLLRLHPSPPASPQPAVWFNPAWCYAPAATHGDSSAFRRRMQEYARQVQHSTECAQAALRG